MPFSNNDLLLPVSCLLNLSGACDLAILEKNNRFFIKYDGIVGIADSIEYMIELDDVHTNIFASEFLELTNSYLVEKDCLSRQKFNLCEYSKTGNSYWTLGSNHYLLTKKFVPDDPLESCYYCELTKFVSWLKSIGKEISITSFRFHLFVTMVLKSSREYRLSDSKEAEKLFIIFYEIWGEEAVQVLDREITNYLELGEPTHTLKNHQYLTSLTAEEAALIACGIEEFPTFVQFDRKLRKSAFENGDIAEDIKSENGNVAELPKNYNRKVFHEANAIFEALLEEVYYATRWIIFASPNTEQAYFDDGIDSHPPEMETVLRLDNFDRNGNDNPNELKITKKSLAKWFLLSQSSEKASIFQSHRKIDVVDSLTSSNGLHISEHNVTNWLKILTKTIELHFSEDRTTDSKKDSVVEWVKEEAVRVGINPSDNIANAIFTIIKPDNHNPKKKKG